jgi:endonuclease/exonuclease/phosphatase family metal-dependent hydrolase
MRMMTFNLRFENEMDGDNAWSHRRELVLRLIRRHAPDILGTQEGKRSQLLYLRDQLPEYLAHAPGRIMDERGQYPTLYVRKDRFGITRGEECWLSKTPHVYLSKDWDSAFPRMMSAAELRGMRDGRSFWVGVTHLDHRGAMARFEQARMIASWVAAKKTPVIFMGDFNADPASAVHQVLTGADVGLRDTWQALAHGEGRGSATHHDFRGNPEGPRIDWILASAHFRVRRARVLKDQCDGRYPSDHFPYAVDLDWRSDA